MTYFGPASAMLIFLVKLIHVSSPPLGLYPTSNVHMNCSIWLHIMKELEWPYTIFFLFRVSLRGRLLRVVQKLEWTV